MASPESVINGRFKFLERPNVAPGKCACCGSVERPVVDFNFDLDFYGVVYLCTDCLREAADIAGITSTEVQVAPLPIDYEALNEFFRAVSHTIDRINLVIPDYVIPLATSVQENDGSDDAVDDGAISEPQSDTYTQPELTLVEGPNDSPSPVGSVSGFGF